MKLNKELRVDLDTPSIESLEKSNFFRLSADRVMVLPEEQKSLDADSFGFYSSATFYSLLKGLVKNSFCGRVKVDTGFGVKVLNFKRGALVFASSRAIDDRLGEVLYRRGIINLDQLTEAAVQVTPDMKFGQVLVNKEILTSNDVWEALKQQVVHILRTIMIPERLYVELFYGEFDLFTELYYMTPTIDLVLSAHIYGHQVRSFFEGVEEQSIVEINSNKCSIDSLKDGTFVKDFFQIVDAKAKLPDIVKASKLSEVNTIATLMELFHRGYFKISGEPFKNYPDCRDDFPELFTRITAYNRLTREFKDLFNEAGVEIPLPSIIKFGDEVSNSCGHSLSLDKGLQITEESMYRLTDFVKASGRLEETMSSIKCLMQFIKLVAADHLPVAYYRQLKDYLSNAQQKAS